MWEEELGEARLRSHVLVCGATGSGKTETLLRNRRRPLIAIAGQEAVQVKELARRG